MDSSIQKTYHDALFYASAPINKDKQFYLTPSELKVLLKLIHYSTSHEDITFQNKDISSHIFLSETTIKNSIESLLRKKYIASTRDIFNNRLGFKSKRTIHINWTFIEDIAKIIINTEKTAFTKIKYQSKDGTPKEVDTSSYDEGGTLTQIQKSPSTVTFFDCEDEYGRQSNRSVLSNDNPKEDTIPQQVENVPQIEDKSTRVEFMFNVNRTLYPSTIKHTLDCGKTFDICTKYVDVWNRIKDNPQVIDKLNKEYKHKDQIDFNMALDKAYNKQKNE